jgi:hypothetical protein
MNVTSLESNLARALQQRDASAEALADAVTAKMTAERELNAAQVSHKLFACVCMDEYCLCEHVLAHDLTTQLQ